MFFVAMSSEIGRMYTAPFIVVIMGLPGSGKTYLAPHLARLLNAQYISSDQIRRALPGRYDLSDRLRVYQAMAEQASQWLVNGQTVVLDATFHREVFRDLARSLAYEGPYPLHFVEMVASDADTRRRTSQARPDSEATYAVYRKLQREAEPLKQPHLQLDSSQLSLDIMLERTLDHLTHDC